jgi:hypothetical protein
MAVTEDRKGAGVTRRDLWCVAVCCAALSAWPPGARARDVAPTPVPITVDTTLIRADANDIHADQ